MPNPVHAKEPAGGFAMVGIHWRSGVFVTAEEVLERDEDLKLVLPGRREVGASLAEDPTTA
jgi:hypothetical protein